MAEVEQVSGCFRVPGTFGHAKLVDTLRDIQPEELCRIAIVVREQATDRVFPANAFYMHVLSGQLDRIAEHTMERSNIGEMICEMWLATSHMACQQFCRDLLKRQNRLVYGTFRGFTRVVN